MTACLAAAKKSFGYEINFDFDLWFSEVFHGKNGFDVIIANPPYVGEKGHKELFTEIKKGGLGGFYLGKVDIFYFFFHLALNIGRPGAIIAFITTNSYPTADGVRKLRFDFRKRATVKNFINLGELKLFEAALGQHNMITILSKSNNPSVVAQNCITKRNGMASSEVLQDILQARDAQTWCYTMRQLDFSGEKIVSPQRSLSNTFALSSSHWVASMDVYFITQNVKTVSLKYVLALLNSRLYYFWLYHRGKRKGEALELYQKPLSEVPIKRIAPDDQKPFIRLADRILAAKQRDPEAETVEWEREIDRLVYDLYDLTTAEIKLVEESIGR